MGWTEETDVGDAAALTPSLFLGHYLYGIEHTVLGSRQYVEQAVACIENGGTVLTADPTLAMEVMVTLGIPVPEALDKLDRVTHVLDHVDVSF